MAELELTRKIRNLGQEEPRKKRILWKVGTASREEDSHRKVMQNQNRSEKRKDNEEIQEGCMNTEKWFPIFKNQAKTTNKKKKNGPKKEMKESNPP